MNALQYFIQEAGCPTPSMHIVLGSGLSGVFSELNSLPSHWEAKGELPFSALAELKASTAPGHAGVFKLYQNIKNSQSLLFQVGRLHGYEGLSPRQVVQPVLCSREIGVKNYLLTNASGALKKTFKVGSVMMIQDQVNMTGTSSLWGPNPQKSTGEAWGPRFPDLSEVYSAQFQKKLGPILKKHKLNVVKGIYLGLPGPAYETPSEVALYSKWGMGAVGMSTVWEAIALKHSGAEVGGISIISNMGCGLVKKEKLNHTDVEKEVKKVASKLVPALFEFGNQYA